jgi:hypothetical protein
MLTLHDARQLLSQSGREAVILLRGDAAVRDVAMDLAVTALLSEQPIFWIEAANVFDLYALTEAAKRWGIDPHPLLGRLLISRTSTVYQLETLCAKRLGPDLSRRPGALAVLSDPLALFRDEDVPEAEARRVLTRVASDIARLRRRGLRLLVTAPDSPGRPGLLGLLRPAATRAFALRRAAEGPALLEETPQRNHRPAEGR